MAAASAMEDHIGCGFLAAIFRRRQFRPRPAALFPESRCPKRHLAASGSPRRKRSSPSNDSNRRHRGTELDSQLVNSPSNILRRRRREPTSASISDLQKSNDGSLRRALTGNAMVLGRGNGAAGEGKVVKKKVEKSTGYRLGNVYRYHSPPTDGLSPADGFKWLGNEKYRQGKYEEALALYDQAIAVDPSNACYYANKSAALIGLGRLLEAAVPCREAVRLDSLYYNAHYRLATLYLRFGAGEKAMYHYKCSGHKARDDDIARAQGVKDRIDCCVEAQDREDWETVMSEGQSASALGADSALQIFSMKAEALLNLGRHDEAYAVMQDSPFFNIDAYAELFGSSATANVLQVRALVYAANGRFEDAVSDVRRALRFESSDDGVKLTAERVRAVASARLNGNRMFEGSRFSEALTAYNKGLEKDPRNSILLYNRSACRAKLGQFENAVEDCTAALAIRPSYTKARLRRANCYTKLEKWEAAVGDYAVLIREIPADETITAAMSEAKARLKSIQHGRVVGRV
ncbi:TPR repeat-containing thioredoxin TTL4-like [Andrographis paniculata]|uniref:TPR repeat-containing thioredoxin TTL4-like n=1 Tax=Andrographis paniculata TaxID=175694 RepID=UPI0021E79C57|nr:TPR repeat-containing thioredoxin TTL4-like [Andrographis paniculata]